MKEFLIALAAMFVVFAMLSLGPIAGAHACHCKAEAQGLESDWGFWTGCLVKTENGWMDYDRLRYMK